MSKYIIKTGVAFLISLAVISAEARAQETEENVRVEYIMCKLNEGFTFADVMEDAKEYGEKVKASGNKYNQYLMRPMIAGERLGDYTHVLVGVWPNGLEMYKEYGNYVNKHIEEDMENSPHTCGVTVATMDRIVINDFRENEQMDNRAPVQLADCSLKDGVSMDYAVEVQKKVGESARKNNMGGYGVHFQTPYLGFQDVGYDFVSMVWWQSFEHRANMAQNYYKVANEMGSMMESAVTCKEPRAYFSELIFRTWE